MKLLWLLLALVPYAWYTAFTPLLAWQTMLGPVRFFKEEVQSGKGAGDAPQAGELTSQLETARKYAPANPFVHLYTGLWHAIQGHKDEARAELSESSQLASGDLGAFFDLVFLPCVGGCSGPPVSREELSRKSISPADAVRLMPVALFGRELDLAARLISKAAEQESKGFEFQRQAGLFQLLRGETRAATRLLDRAWIVRSTANAAPGYGLGFIPFHYWIAESDNGPKVVLGPWLGTIASSLRENREATAETLFNLAVLLRMQENFRRSLQLAQLLGEKFTAEVATMRLERQLERYLYPRNFASLICDLAGRYEIDPLLIHSVIREESHYDASSVSGAGALGLMQLMPQTGRWIAAKLKIAAFEDRQLKQPSRNIEFGCWYLSHLAQSLPEDARSVEWVLAAYNGGPGNAANWLARWKKAGGDPLDQISFPETRQYVQRVRKTYLAYRRIWAPPAAPPREG